MGILTTTPTRPVMDYSEIETTEQLLNAFKQCQNAGEEIQLFESLAERANPPVDAFVEILRKIKLETVLALAIQAFGKITDGDVKARLKGSEDLLVMLCEQAKSGATDLIRWSAATTIKNAGFSFIDVSQYLTEEPNRIIQRIVRSKVKVLTDADRNRQIIRENNDYGSFIDFWIYGATYELLSSTMNCEGGNAQIAIQHILEQQGVWGVKNSNYWLRYSFDKSKSDENIIFTAASQLLSSLFLLFPREPFNSSQIKILLTNQIYCLNSKSDEIKKLASDFLCSYIISDLVSVDERIINAIDRLKNSVNIINKTAQKLDTVHEDEKKLTKESEALDRQISSIEEDINSISSKLVSIHSVN